MLLALLITLGQTGEPAAEPAPAPAAAEEKAEGTEPKKVGVQLNNGELERMKHRISKMDDPVKAAEAAAELTRKMPKPMDVEAYKRQALILPDVKNFAELPEEEQVKYSAREFFTQLLAGDARAMVNSCAFPFQLEERRLQNSDELFQEWLRNLRAKRTDLLTLYDIEVLTPADMEKKYGKPPARLSNMPWRNAKTYVAIANLSGHAAVAVLRQTGPGWAVVGYAD